MEHPKAKQKQRVHIHIPKRTITKDHENHVAKMYPKANKWFPDSIKNVSQMDAEDVLEAPSPETSKCVRKVTPKGAKIAPKMNPSSSEMLQKWMPKRFWKHLHHKRPNASEKLLQRDLPLLPK